MPNMQKEELAKWCETVLVPLVEDAVGRRVKPIQDTLEIVARGVAELQDRLDEWERGQ